MASRFRYYRAFPWPAFLVSAILATIIVTARANGEVRSFEDRIVTLFEENHPAMVRVKAVYPPKEDSEEKIPQVVIGTGFFISREGLILTNASVVSDPLRVWIEHNQTAYSAEVVGMEDRANIAFLRTHTLPDSFTFLHLADRADLPPVGSFAVRLSMPLEFSASPTFGMISGYESRFGDRIFPCTYVRTTIPSGPGDGGSAYLDLNGRLIGIQVGSLPEVGSSYILPARAALRIRDDMLFSGTVTYGWIGFEVELASAIETGPQVVLSEVFPDSPGSEAGLIEGDVLLEIGDYTISALDDLRNAMFYTRVGQFVDVRVRREGEPRTFSIKVAARPDDEPIQVLQPVDQEEPVDPLKASPVEDEQTPLPFAEDLNVEPPPSGND